MTKTLSPEVVEKAHNLIKQYVVRTPILESKRLNDIVGGRVICKFEGAQKTGAFKFRGAMNALLTLQEQGKLGDTVCTFSSGNHAQALACAANIVGVEATILIPEFASSFKIEATKAHGANVILTKTRQEAESKVKQFIAQGAKFIHPYDNPDIIAGQGTACYEALQDTGAVNAVFVPCGGGGLTSGSYLASRLLSADSEVYGCEPKNANDAAISYRAGAIHKLENTPDTIADGVRTLYVSELTFAHLKRLAGFYEISEKDIIGWTREVFNHLKVVVEPTSALPIASARKWFENKDNKGKTALAILSGGNVAPETYVKIWS